MSNVCLSTYQGPAKALTVPLNAPDVATKSVSAVPWKALRVTAVSAASAAPFTAMIKYKLLVTIIYLRKQELDIKNIAHDAIIPT